MVHIFEKREIENPERKGSKVILERISAWRNGLAVARACCNSQKPCYYYLIDKNYSFVFSNYDDEEDELQGEQIERVFGGYYLVRGTKFNGCRTFPGQDIDTEYYYKTVVKLVLDENGVPIADEEEKNKAISMIQTYELDDNIVLCNQKDFYDLNTYEFKFSLKKNVEPGGDFFSGGWYRLRIIQDYRIFYTLVSNKRIARVFSQKEFESSLASLGINIMDKEGNVIRVKKNQPSWKVSQKPEDVQLSINIIPTIETVIERYLYTLPITCPFDTDWVRWEFDGYQYKFGGYRYSRDFYYKDGDDWGFMSGSSLTDVLNNIDILNDGRPNFVEEIIHVMDGFIVNGESYSVYRFEVKPFGFINHDGIFDYNFDVENINW